MGKRKTTKTARPPRTTKAPGGTAEERALLARAEKKIRDLLRKGERTAWTIGRTFDDLARARLHRAAGFVSLEAYADARFSEGFRTLKRYRRVAIAFRKATVVRHGVTKLDLALTYIDLTPEHERPAEIPRLEIRVPDKRGKNVRLVPFAKATVGDLERAIVGAQAKPTASDDLTEARAKKTRAELQALVAAPKGSHRHAPSVRSHATPDRTVRVDVVGIDLDDLERVGRALIAMAKKHPPKTRGAHAA